MLFNSYPFIFLFLPIVLAWLFRARPGSNLAPVIWLALASLAFYAFSNWQFVALLLASIAFNYVVGCLLIARKLRPRRAYGTDGGVAGDLLVLGIFKYAGFFAANVDALFSTASPSTSCCRSGSRSTRSPRSPSWSTPIAAGARYALPHYALFVTYFPHLIAGPILHHKEMMPQFERAEPSGRIRTDPVRPDHLRDRPVQEVLIADGIQPWSRSRSARPRRLRPGLGRRAGLHVPALFRFLRLFRHGDRHVADVRIPCR